MRIRKEEPKDYETVYSVVKTAFDSAEHADGNEHYLVNDLRKGNAFISELSMVAEINGRIVGHIMFTEARVNEKTVLVTIMKDLENMRVLNEVEEDKVAGGVPILHPGHHYDPPAAPEEPQEGGAEGTW